jgi:hypothetical protein
MSFRCYGCDETKQHGQLVVLETREKNYYGTHPWGEPYLVGRGRETVMEKRFCEECIAAAQEAMAEVIQ